MTKSDIHLSLVVFYDRNLRLWTAYAVDEQGNQIGPAGYGPTKQAAIADVTIGEAK